MSSGSGLSANNDTSVRVSWSVNSASKSSSKATEEEDFHDSDFRDNVKLFDMFDMDHD